MYLNKHQERGIRSDGTWINVMSDNSSNTTFASKISSAYSDTTLFESQSRSPSKLDELNLDEELPIPVMRKPQATHVRPKSLPLELPFVSSPPLSAIPEEDDEGRKCADTGRFIRASPRIGSHSGSYFLSGELNGFDHPLHHGPDSASLSSYSPPVTPRNSIRRKAVPQYLGEMTFQ